MRKRWRVIVAVGGLGLLVGLRVMLARSVHLSPGHWVCNEILPMTGMLDDVSYTLLPDGTFQKHSVLTVTDDADATLPDTTDRQFGGRYQLTDNQLTLNQDWGVSTWSRRSGVTQLGRGTVRFRVERESPSSFTAVAQVGGTRDGASFHFQRVE